MVVATTHHQPAQVSDSFKSPAALVSYRQLYYIYLVHELHVVRAGEQHGNASLLRVQNFQSTTRLQKD